MEIGSGQWIKLVIEGAAQLDVTVDERQAAQMAFHARELVAWNRRLNLTAITDPAEVAVKHFVDSLAGLEAIPAQAHLLDIGSGGGFPGLPLKIMRPDQPITLVDSVRKKINFLKHIIRTLQLRKIDTFHGRAETLGAAGPFGAITCRALADLEIIRQLALPLLAADGLLVIYKGPHEIPGIPFGRPDFAEGLSETFHFHEFAGVCRHYRLPFRGDARRLIVLRRQQ